MKKKTFITLLIIFRVFGGYAQENRKDWNDGKLTWDDFHKKEQSAEASELKYFIGYNTGKQKSNDTTLIRIQTFCYMDRKLSWINNNFINSQYLKYNQIIFDIAELYRRKLQYELDRANSINEAEIKFSRNYTKMYNEMDRFKEESSGGQNREVIEQWNLTIKKELNNFGNIDIPKFSKRNFGYALHVGLGSGRFTGSLGQHFGQTFNFMFGFDFAYKNSILYLNGTMARGKVKTDYISDKNWYRGQHANVAIIDVSYGYAIVDKSKVKLSPFAGLGITELSGENMDNKEDPLRIVDYNFIFGINADYKIRKRIKLVPNPYFGLKESVETSIRARLYITRVSYYNDLNGYSINLTVGLCGFGNIIRLEE